MLRQAASDARRLRAVEKFVPEIIDLLECLDEADGLRQDGEEMIERLHNWQAKPPQETR